MGRRFGGAVTPGSLVYKIKTKIEWPEDPNDKELKSPSAMKTPVVYK
jgi:hypothetical protein